MKKLKRFGFIWVLGVFFAGLLVGLWGFNRYGGASVGQDQTSGLVIGEGGGPPTDPSTTQSINAPVILEGPILKVVSSKVFLIGDTYSAVLVVSETAVPDLSSSLAADTNVTGTMEPIPPTSQFSRLWGLSNQDVQLLKGDQYYISANNVDLPSPSSFY